MSTHHATTKSISFLHRNQVKFDLHMTIKSIWAAHKRTSIFSCLYLEQVIFGPHSKTKSTLIPTLRTQSVSIRTLKPTYFRAAHNTEVYPDPRTKKPVKFDPYAQNKSNSNPHNGTKLILPPSLKSSQIWCSLQYHLDFDAPTQPQLISIRTLNASRCQPLHKNQISADLLHWNEVIFNNPHTKTKSISSYTKIKPSSILHTKIKSI